MVVSVAKATSVDYYTGGDGVGEGAENYYLDAVEEGEPAGLWSGTGADRLGLAGEVDAEDMRVVFSEFTNPNTGESIGFRPAQRQPLADRVSAALAAEPDALPERIEEIRAQVERSDRQSVIGWDATFSPAKSVTVAHTAAHRAELAALRSGDMDRAAQFGAIRVGIESAISEANTTMLAYAETLATTRTGGGAGAPVQWVAAPGLTVASFFQHTNRNIDPQLHVHNVILNRAYSADGKARALDGADLLAQKHALGAVADRVLEEGLTALGFEVELRPDGMARELTIVPTAVADLFSSRARQVSARVAELIPAAEEKAGRTLTDLEVYRLKQAATLSTRATKGSHATETTEEMIDRWWATTHEVGTSLDVVADAIDDHLTARRLDPTHLEVAGGVEWSPSGVMAEAVAAVGQARAAWRPADLMLEISRRLPSLGGLDAKTTMEVLQRLTDEAIAGPLVRQVSGQAVDEFADIITDQAFAATDVAAQLDADSYTRPSSRLYATTDTLMAEESLRRAAIERGGHHLAAADVTAWLDEHTPTIGADQRAAVIGLATTDARLAVLLGPAGTGKSFAAGAFANAWADITTSTTGGARGRVVGLAVSQIATQVLRDDGVANARNITQWLGIQDRLAGGSTHPNDAEWRLGAADVVMVDEASMVATADLHRIHTLTEQAGARLVLTGDPRQLGAVDAGGVMGLLDGHAETYALTQVRRFADPWEATASLNLRDGDPDALAAYDRHGRLLSHDTSDAAAQAAATAAVADRLDGRAVVVVTGSNKQAAQVATNVRDQLVDLGLVHEDGILLGRDGCTAGVGDLITARRNNYGLTATNRGQYQVTAVGDDGSLTVTPANHGTGPDSPAGEARVIRLPAEYVAEHVQLGYASTVHAAQGLTVDAAHLVTDGGLDALSLYVGLSRGRLRNTAHVALNTPTSQDTRPASRTSTGGQVRLEDASSRASARSVLEGCLERDASNRAATVEAEHDTNRLSSMNLLAGRQEALVRIACRERLDRHLDHLTTNGVLDEDTRARLGADQGTEHLSRLLRAVEQAGRDPLHELQAAISARPLTGADSVAQVLSHRITGGRALPHPLTGAAHGDAAATGARDVPGDIAGPAARHLQNLATRIEARRQDLGEQAAQDPPAWVLSALGPVPGDDAARADWITRAGTVAAHREATGWAHPQQPISTMPGLAATERRASHTAAWEALGRPEAGLDESAMTEGQLRIRVRAGEVERAWAPPHADAALKATETEHEAARQAAALTRARAEHATQAGQHDHAARLAAEAAAHEQTAAIKAAAIEPLRAAADTRARWAAASAVTFEEDRRAQTELTRRGLSIGDEPDRTTTDTWLADEQAARQADDAYRTITETDLLDHTTRDSDAAEHEDHDSAAQATGQAWTEPADHDTAETPAVELPAAVDQDETAAELAPDAGERGWGQGRSPAHAVITENPSVQEIETAATLTAAALDTLADRASQEASHHDLADIDDTAAGESDEAGRRRRESADAHATEAAARVNDRDVSVSDA